MSRLAALPCSTCSTCSNRSNRSNRWLALAPLLVAYLVWAPEAQAQSQVVRDPPTKKPPAKEPPASKPAPARDPRDGKTRLDPDGPPPVYEPHRSDSTHHSGSSSKATRSGPSSSSIASSSSGFARSEWFRYSLALGGHLSIAGDDFKNLTTERLGGGLDVTLLAGPHSWPLLIGVQTGFDSFGGVSRTFMYRGDVDDYRLNRMGFWLHGVLRLEPEWKVRPHLDLLAGLWMLDVSVGGSARSSSSADDSLGTAVTGSYGLGTGVRYVADSGVSIGLSGVYMRGGGMTAPYAQGAVVVDDVLYYDERRVDSVSQFMLMLEIGFDSGSRP